MCLTLDVLTKFVQDDRPHGPGVDSSAMAQPPDRDPTGAVRVERVRKAYEQVADQLRELILNGSITPGQRLPNEAALSVQFGVRRATVREALRVLTTRASSARRRAPPAAAS